MTPDLIIIGSGSASFSAAIRASELGASVLMIERDTLGGTCVNVGCVPSKALIRAAEAKHAIERETFDGLRGVISQFDLQKIIRQKDALVDDLRRAKYEDVLDNYPSVRLLRGNARILPDGAVEVHGETFRDSRVLIATGSSPWVPPIPGLQESGYLTSTTLMELKEPPKSMIVIGGGVVALELAQTFARFGTSVTVLQRSHQILSSEDPELTTALAQYLEAEGLQIKTKTDVTRVEGSQGAHRVHIEDGRGADILEAEALFVATGRRPNTRGLGLMHAEIMLGELGEVLVDDQLRTTRPGFYAAGDVIGDPAYVYVAAYAGRIAAENAIGDMGTAINLRTVPRVVFTSPALACVGISQADAQYREMEVDVATLPMAYVPRAIAARDTRGLIKLVAERRTGKLVGAHILAPEAGDIIQTASLAIQAGFTVKDIGAMLHPYLTNAEALKLAAQTFNKSVKELSCCAS